MRIHDIKSVSVAALSCGSAGASARATADLGGLVGDKF